MIIIQVQVLPLQSCNFPCLTLLVLLVMLLVDSGLLLSVQSLSLNLWPGWIWLLSSSPILCRSIQVQPYMPLVLRFIDILWFIFHGWQRQQVWQPLQLRLLALSLEYSLVLPMNRLCFLMPIGIRFGMVLWQMKFRHCVSTTFGFWFLFILRWLLLIVVECTRSSIVQMAALSVIRFSWLLEALLSKKVLIILKILVLSLNKPLFGCFSPLRFDVVLLTHHYSSCLRVLIFFLSIGLYWWYLTY